MPLLKNNESRIHFLGTRVRLAPGINEVGEEDWAKLKGQSMVKRLLAARVVEVVRSAGDANVTDATMAGGVATAETDISSMSEADATRLVGETVDRALLTKWAGQAKGGVREALDKQLAALGVSEEERAQAFKRKR